jgi:chemotaxis protein MotB
MRTTFHTYLIKFSVLIASLLFLQSCVSQLKYNRLSTEVSSLRNERDETMKRAESAKVDNLRLDKENKSLHDENAKLKLDSAQSGAMYRKNKQLLNDVFDKYDRLDKSYNSLLANSSNERGFTEKEVQRKEADIAKKEKELADMKIQIAQAQAELEKKKEETTRLSQDVGAKDNKIKDMEAQLAARDKSMLEVKAKMTSALLTLNNTNLQVSQKDGKVYVVLPNQTLFSTGSYVLQQAGQDAIFKVAQVLIQNPELEVSVEGHTDASPFKPAAPAPVKKGKGAAKKAVGKTAPTIKDNWDLSSLRATTVARALYMQGVAGGRIAAIGRGEFFPLDISMSEEAKMRNRRIEIVISPNLTKLYELIGK